MAIRNPFKTINGQTYIDKSMTDKSPNSDDNMRVIWRAGGELKHIHVRWKSLHLAHADLWSWLSYEPETLWCYNIRLYGWFRSMRTTTKGDSRLENLQDKNVPQDIQLYNMLLGE